MQAVTRELNFSETTFVTGEAGGFPRARSFTPVWELAFAGDPTLGTVSLLRDAEPRGTLELAVGVRTGTIYGAIRGFKGASRLSRGRR